MRRLVLLLLAALLSLIALGHSAPATAAAAKAPAQITFVQAVPGATVSISVDGRQVASAAQVGDVLGPFALAPGKHDLSFAGDSVQVDTSLRVKAGATRDVVLHLPAEVDGKAVVHSYAAPTGAIGPGKARVMLAHTATVAPADVKVNGQTVFTNIANGEFADADVPEGSIEVALVPSGSATKPILGPLDVSLAAGTLSMIYAYGNPRNGSMNVIAHTAALASDGSVQPSRIDTGSAGIVLDGVERFGAPSGAESPWTTVLGLLTLVGALALTRQCTRRRQTPRPPPSR